MAGATVFLMLITTQAVVFPVSGAELDQIAGTLQAKSDAREVAVKNIDELLINNEMGLDHGTLLKEAVQHVTLKARAQEMAKSVDLAATGMLETSHNTSHITGASRRDTGKQQRT